MADTPRRPILKLKTAVALPKPPAPPAPVVPPAPAGTRWKCKPCGGSLYVTGDEAPESEIRCPKCSARLGLAKDFDIDNPARRVRARPAPTP